VCEGAFDVLALLAAGVPRVVALCGGQGWHWGWTREVRELVLAHDRRCRRAAAVAPAGPPGSAAGQAGGRAAARVAWAAGVLAVGAGPGAVSESLEAFEVPAALRETWDERGAILVAAGRRPPSPQRSAILAAPPLTR